MNKPLSFTNRTILDIVNLVVGLGLALSPWYLGYAAETQAAWNAWIVGAAMALLAAAALFKFHQAEEWANLALGLWTLIAPWLLGFSALTAAVAAHVIAGLVVAIMAGGSLWFTTSRPFSTA